jgi:hypothetical protein
LLVFGTSAGRGTRNVELDGRSGSVAIALQKREDVYRRYAIVDRAMIREAAGEMDREAKVR